MHSIINYLICFGIPSLDSFISVYHSNRHEKDLNDFIFTLIDACEGNEFAYSKLPYALSLHLSKLISSQIKFFANARSLLNNNALSKEAIEIISFVNKNGFLDLNESNLIIEKFGNFGAESRLKRYIQSLLIQNSVDVIDRPKDKFVSKNPKPRIPSYRNELEIAANPTFPLVISNSFQVISVGNIVYDRPAYHTERYIYPVGYVAERLYSSIRSANERIWYRCMILDGGNEPLFRVEAKDDPTICYEGPLPTTPWVNIFREVRKLKHLNTSVVTVSGPEYYGLTYPIVTMLIQRLPGASLCSKYIMKNFEGESQQNQIQQQQQQQQTNVALTNDFGKKKNKKVIDDDDDNYVDKISPNMVMDLEMPVTRSRNKERVSYIGADEDDDDEDETSTEFEDEQTESDFRDMTDQE
ncbi:F/Y-rich N-terminus family protein [Histomonas meleagridis]|uniref:F/Y-rich N-terminus family protein n=1 Tax=Histomonas meleagridis TaxID=135588 RepID=UPI0035599D6F|nr:F/Y-rich N-terminus family protein [Histomonas meleagridis]KAH0802497.1 F/Y-rich N-terminus family protein [Histomonas meleagridis]